MLRRGFRVLMGSKPISGFASFKHISNWNQTSIGLAKQQNTMTSNLPLDNNFNTTTLERNEIESRMLKICSGYEKIDLKKLNWDGDIQRDLGLDSLERVALLTSFEHEFCTLWEDRVFDNLKSLSQIVNELLKDPTVY